MNNFNERAKSIERSIFYFSHRLSRSSPVDYDDAQQEMLISVWRASLKYDPKQGAFSTLAVHGMRNRMKTLLDRYIKNAAEQSEIEDDGAVVDSKADKVAREDIMMLDDIQVRLRNKAASTKSISDERAYNLFVLMRSGLSMSEVAEQMKVRTSWLSRLFDEKVRRMVKKEGML